MPLIGTHLLDPHIGSMPVYNGLDTMVDYEIDDNTDYFLDDPNSKLIYEFELGMQAPALEMMLRGFRVDPVYREQTLTTLQQKLVDSQRVLNILSQSVWDQDLNPNSTKQLKSLFYDYMGIKPIRKWVDGEMTYPMNRETLESLQGYFYLQPIIGMVLLCRDLAKSIQVLSTQIDTDMRWRCSYNIGGTKTGRWSSSKSPLGTGNNFQNITEDLRRNFIPDPGYKLYGIDLEQAESREVGWFCGTILNDWTYLDMIERGDLHTQVARMCWPKLPWSGDIKRDRQIADRKFYRHFTYRDACKRLGHGCLTAGHEVLTPAGWVPIETKPDVIMQFSEYKSEWAKVSNWFDKTWKGDFHIWNGQSISVEMTDSHRVYYTTDDKGLRVDQAKSVPKSARIPSGWGYIGGNSNIKPEIARLIAAYQCDGNYSGVGKQIRFHFHKQRKFDRLEALAATARIPFTLQGGEKAAITVEDPKFWPKYAGAYLLTWPSESLMAYLEEIPYWDGHFAETSTCIMSTNREHLDWIKTCNRLIGTGGNIQKPVTSGFGSTVYKLQYNNRQYANMGSVTRSVENKEAQVYCPTVPSHAFYIRRNGKISVTGNSNYLGTPRTMSGHTKIPLAIVEKFQDAYFSELPCLPRMHQWIAQEIQTKRCLINAFGRRRDFFDRTDSDETIRQAVAYMFQSTTGDRLNLGLWRLWYYMGRRIQILSQLHDAVYFQAKRNDDENEVITTALELMKVQLTHTNLDGTKRRFVVPGEAQGGFNWAHRFKLDPEGNRIEWNKYGLDKINLH
jgi:DNA polymerase family A